MQPIRDCKVQAHSAPGCRKPLSSEIYFCASPWEYCAYCDPVGDVSLWASHWDLVVPFATSLLSEWKMVLDTWENTR